MVLHDTVGGSGHLLLIGSHYDDVVGVVGDAGGHGAGLQTVALDIAQSDMMGILVPLDNGHLENIIFHINMVDVAGVLGDDFTRYQADDGVGTAILEVLCRQLGQVEGVVGALDQIGIDFRCGEVTELTVIHQLAPLKDHFDIEIVEVIDDDEVAQVAGGDGAAVIEQEVSGGGVAGGLHGDDGVYAQGDGFLHDVVDVALFQQVVGVLVVGTEHAAVHIFAAQQRHQSLQIPRGGALADHNELAPLQLGQGVVQVGALVVGVYTGGDVGIEIIAGETRSMPVDFLVVGLGGYDLLHHLGVAVDGAYEVHHLSQALDPGMVIEGVDGPVVQNGAGLIQRCGGYAGGEHKAHIHRQILGGLKHIFNAVGAHDIGDLVGVGDDGGGTVGQNGLCKLRGAHQGALQMDVGIQEAGQHNLAGDIQLHLAVVLAHAHNESLGHSNVAAAQLIGKDIDIGGVFQHQIGGHTPGSHINDMELLVQLTVDFSGIALFHRHM